jgi:hypothetical protein
VLGISGAIVVAALAVATYRAVQLSTWQDAATRVGEVWAQGNGDRLVQARFDGDTLVVVVEGAGSAGDDARLPRLLHGSVPDGTPVIVNRVAGARRHVGDVRKPDQA